MNTTGDFSSSASKSAEKSADRISAIAAISVAKTTFIRALGDESTLEKMFDENRILGTACARVLDDIRRKSGNNYSMKDVKDGLLQNGLLRDLLVGQITQKFDQMSNEIEKAQPDDSFAFLTQTVGKFRGCTIIRD